ncbi:MAG TPA: complex I subunit 5 family protein [Anaerolineaceae bacterium]|jgi:proton-translocating NADH-quinone oxidoreductase chain N|nr:complex I subunit 5 family protein [Anaerolineaceae bacterium]
MNPVFAILWLIGLPLLASPVIYLVGRGVARRDGESSSRNPARWVALITTAAMGFPLFVLAQDLLTTNKGFVGLLFADISLRFDGISLVLAASVWLLGLMVMLYSGPYMAREVGEEKYYALLSAMMAAMIGLGTAADLFNLWVWFETMAITSFMLVAFYRDEPASLEAGFKYLVQSAIGSALVLMGIALVFFSTGTLNLQQLSHVGVGGVIPPTMIVAAALMIIGFGVKTALVPMHTWLPDAHSQAPSGISAMLSGVVIAAGLVALLRSMGVLAYNNAVWGPIMLGFGVLNMVAGNLMALRQTVVKRLLAYSSLAHIGYMLIGIGATVTFGNLSLAPGQGGAGAFFHLFTHAMMKGLAFLAAGALLYSLHIAKGQHAALTVTDLNGAAKRYPLIAMGLSIAVLGLGGLPPLAGFMSKWQIFVGAAANNNWWMIALVAFAALNSVLSLGYYAPLVNRMVRNEPSEAVTAGKRVPVLMSVPVAILSLVVLVFGFYPALFNGVGALAGQALFRIIAP